jgi:pimeloyl-ACP methyl ester carboxylesterase
VSFSATILLRGLQIMKLKVAPLMLAVLISIFAHGQVPTPDLVGIWQGTLAAGKGLRIVLHVAKADTGGPKATLFSIDQGSSGIPVTFLTLQGTNFKFAIPLIGGAYEGTVSADGNSIQGTWTQNKNSQPLNFQRATPETAWPTDSSSHTIQFVVVDDNVKLEVLDWGGSGRPLVLLAGGGNDAHVYDKFAPKLTPSYHVYGITRRGFGASSAPTPANGNYSADRLGDDVLAVLDALKLNRPVLAGHSIAGEELSSIATRHPEKVAGLIYLDAGYSYAFYDRSRGDLTIDAIELRKKLEQLELGMGPRDLGPLIKELLDTSLPGFEKDLQEKQKDLQAMPAALLAAPAPAPARASVHVPDVFQALWAGQQKYTNIRVPVLAIFAVPHDLGPALGSDPAARAAYEARETVTVGAQADAFEKGVPFARVVRLPRANHYVFLSNEADVLREMNAFIASLP